MLLLLWRLLPVGHTAVVYWGTPSPGTLLFIGGEPTSFARVNSRSALVVRAVHVSRAGREMQPLPARRAEPVHAELMQPRQVPAMRPARVALTDSPAQGHPARTMLRTRGG